MQELNNNITGNAKNFVLNVWPKSITYTEVFSEQQEQCILIANNLVQYIIDNNISRNKAFNSELYRGQYISDNMANFIQELIWSNCYPVE